MLEANGSFTWFNIGGTGINLTWTVTGDPNVNDQTSGSDLEIGKNEGLITGTVHNYVLTFSAPVKNVQFTIQNINQGPQGSFNYYDLLTFTGSPTFSALAAAHEAGDSAPCRRHLHPPDQAQFGKPDRRIKS